MELSNGSRIGVQLDAGDLLIDDHEPQEILWRDDVVGVSFLVSAPKDTQIAKRHATASAVKRSDTWTVRSSHETSTKV